MEMKFYICKICGQIIAIINETGVPVVCCGAEMEELIPGSEDASHEKHVPVIEVHDDMVTVCVGSAPHPMGKDHWIEWIALETNNGNQRKALQYDAEAKACFRLCKGECVKAAYAYCNLHGLWKAVLSRT